MNVRRVVRLLKTRSGRFFFEEKKIMIYGRSYEMEKETVSFLILSFEYPDGFFLILVYVII